MKGLVSFGDDKQERQESACGSSLWRRHLKGYVFFAKSQFGGTESFLSILRQLDSDVMPLAVKTWRLEPERIPEMELSEDIVEGRCEQVRVRREVVLTACVQAVVVNELKYLPIVHCFVRVMIKVLIVEAEHDTGGFQQVFDDSVRFFGISCAVVTV
jgi:hypothetical protein